MSGLSFPEIPFLMNTNPLDKPFYPVCGCDGVLIDKYLSFCGKSPGVPPSQEWKLNRISGFRERNTCRILNFQRLERLSSRSSHRRTSLQNFLQTRTDLGFRVAGTWSLQRFRVLWNGTKNWHPYRYSDLQKHNQEEKCSTQDGRRFYRFIVKITEFWMRSGPKFYLINWHQNSVQKDENEQSYFLKNINTSLFETYMVTIDTSAKRSQHENIL